MNTSLLQRASRAVFANKEYARAVRGRMVGDIPCDLGKAGPYTIARAHFLGKSEAKTFIASCKEEGLTPIFSSYEELPHKRFLAATVIMRPDMDINRQISKKQRWAANKAAKEGVRVEGTTDKKDWQAYLELLRSMYARKDVHYEVDETAFWSQYESELCALYVARHEGNVIAGGIFFINKPLIYYYSGTVHSDYYPLQPMPLILRTVAEDHTTFKVFDLGGCAVDAKKGSETYRINAFKEGFGEKVTYYDYYPNTLVYWIKRIKDLL